MRAITRVATPATEALLLEDARHATGSQLERICRKYASVLRRDGATERDDAARRHVSRCDLDDGMVKIDAVLHPEEAVAVWEALTRVARERMERADGTRICRACARRARRGRAARRSPRALARGDRGDRRRGGARG